MTSNRGHMTRYEGHAGLQSIRQRDADPGVARIESAHGQLRPRAGPSPLSAVQRALGGLERDGLVAARTVGRTRLFRLDPRYFAQVELQRYLRRLAEPEAELRRRI